MYSSATMQHTQAATAAMLRPIHAAFWGRAWRVEILQSGFIAWPSQSTSLSPVDLSENKSNNTGRSW